MTLAEYRALSPLGRRLLALIFVWPHDLDSDELMRFVAAGAHGEKVGNQRLKDGIKPLVSRKIVGRTQPRVFCLEQAFTSEVALAMVREGDEQDWWPGVDVAGERDTRTFHLLRPTKIRVSTDMLFAEGFRCFIRGTAAAASNVLVEALDAGSKSEVVDAVAKMATERLLSEPDFHLSKDDALLKVLPAWLTMCFLYGLPIQKILAELTRLISEGSFVGEQLERAYLAVSLWAGRREALALLQEKRILRGTFYFRGCQALAEGDCHAADLLFKKDVYLAAQRDSGVDLENLPERMLAAMASACANPDKISVTRPIALMRRGIQTGYVRNYRYGRAYSYCAELTRMANRDIDVWRLLSHDAAHTVLDDPSRFRLEEIGSMDDCLILSWCLHALTHNRQSYAQIAEILCRTICIWDERGWSTVAQLLVSLLVGYYDEKSVADYLKGLAGRSLTLLPHREPQPEWQAMLSALEKVVPEAPKKSRPTKRQLNFYWLLNLESSGKDGLCEIASIGGVLRPESGSEDGSRDSFYDYWDMDCKRVRDRMSDRDRALLLSWVANRYGYNYSMPSSKAILQNLAGASNLLCTTEGNRDTCVPISIESRPCEMKSTVGEDGGLVLSVPKWTIEPTIDWVLRKVDESHYVFTEITDKVKRVIAVFRSFGRDGELVIPKEGMSRAASLIEGLTAVMPLAEPSAEDAGQLPRIPAECSLRVRLEYDENLLSVRAVILPQRENQNLAFDPAVGATEKVVVGTAGSYVLVRDLAAEKAAFEPVKNALRDYDTFFDGKSLWQFDDMALALEALSRLKALGDAVPLEWVNERHLNVTYAPKSGVKLTSTRTADEWFRVDGEFRLDDGRVMSVVAMLEAAKNRVGNFVRLSDGDYVTLTKSMSRELDALNAAGRRKGQGVEIVKAAIPMLDNAFEGGEEGLDLPDAMAVTADEIRAAFKRRPGIPKTLNAELRPYQEDGYRWLSRLAACGFGSCLADDMGLGKTIQVIALLLERAQHGPSLVVAPSSVCGNWRHELARFAPTLRPVMALEETIALPKTKALDVVIVSYGYLLFHEDEFAAVTWNGLVLDEAQAIKNDASKRAKMVKRLHAKFRVAATGTPVENRLGELWSLFDFLNPGLLGPAASFTQRFTAEGKAVPELKRLVKPLILRRLKGDVLDDLPEKTEITIPVVLGADERAAYEGCRRHALNQIAESGETSRMTILAELTRLRRFCCHPSLVLPTGGVPSAKMEALVDLLEELHDGHHRALVFSQFTDYLAIVRKTIESHGWSHLYLDGSTPTLERERLVNAFQGGEGDFFLISLKAGGTGLNLTAANYVILLDPWWNPAVENQAADRAHRIGQKNPVTVYRLIASNTVEARVIELHHEKLAIAEDVLDGTSSTSLSPAQLMKLFS